MAEKFKKEVGFIKSSSKKNIGRFEASPSSDSFSSFDYDPQKEKRDEFSPYKHPTFTEESFRPHSSHKPKAETNKLLINKQPNPPKFSNLILRNNFTHELNDKKQRHHLDKQQPTQAAHQQAPHKMKVVRQPAEELHVDEVKEQFEEQLSLSNIHKFQKSRKNQEECKQRNTKDMIKYKHYLQESPSQSSNDEQEFERFQEKATLKHFQPKKERQHADADVDEDLIVEYDKREFKDKSIKTAILNQNPKRTKSKEGLIETRGGVCFQLDTRQFKGKGIELPKKRKRKPSVDPRSLLIQRRQLAKIYDRQARVKVFGY